MQHCHRFGERTKILVLGGVSYRNDVSTGNCGLVGRALVFLQRTSGMYGGYQTFGLRIMMLKIRLGRIRTVMIFDCPESMSRKIKSLVSLARHPSC
jgi:hypothetical protein